MSLIHFDATRVSTTSRLYFPNVVNRIETSLRKRTALAMRLTTCDWRASFIVNATICRAQDLKESTFILRT